MGRLADGTPDRVPARPHVRKARRSIVLQTRCCAHAAARGWPRSASGMKTHQERLENSGPDRRIRGFLRWMVAAAGAATALLVAYLVHPRFGTDSVLFASLFVVAAVAR